MLIGIDRFTGTELSGPARAIQSVETTLTTPFRSQVGIRSYGNDMPNLISQPLNQLTIMDAFAALIDAFEWEPEATLQSYGLVSATEDGKAGIGYSALFTPTNEIFTSVVAKGISVDA